MIAQVALPLPLSKTFTYRAPAGAESLVTPLTRVKVPFGKRSLTGLVVATDEDKEKGLFELNDISDVLDLEPLIDSACFNLCSWASHHYCTPLGLALRFLSPLTMDIEKYLRITSEDGDHLGVKGFRLKRAYAAAGKERIHRYYSEGRLEVHDVFTGQTFRLNAGPNRDSHFVATLFLSGVDARRRHYLSLALSILDAGLNVLLLLPDHGIAGDYFHRFFREKLGEKMLLFGSQVSVRGRSEVLLRVRRQGGYLIIGTRSCLSLPTNNTGLIIVERPEDDGYRNDQGMQFNAVTAATKLAELLSIPICYGSVSPSLDLMKVFEEGHIESTVREPVTRPLEVIEVKRFRAGEKPPQELMNLVVDGLERQEKIVIHTPLKDYAARLYCLSCRRSILCPVCNAAVSFRKTDDRLICWKCGRQFAYHERCWHCSSRLIGFGSTGAEYIEEHIGALVPDASVMRVTGDVARIGGVDRIIDLQKRPRTIIVGTQILSKFYGLTVDRLILFGWEDFLRIAGYRAREHMHQSYCNLIDGLNPSRVHLVTVNGVKEPAEVLSMNSEDFYKEELSRRKAADFPPYMRLFLLKIEGPNRASALVSANRIRSLIEQHGLRHHVVGETSHSDEKGRISILLKGDGSFLDTAMDEIRAVRHVRIEADPSWV